MIKFAFLTALCIAFAIASETAGATDSAAVLPPSAQIATGRLVATTASQADQKVAPYTPRIGRTRPLVAIVGDSGGTVLSDFVIPYGVMVGSGVADVVSVATEPGLLPLDAVRVRPDFTITDFDQKHPDGADYVFVPAVSNPKSELLSAWVSGQAAKGATMVSICNGSLVLANTGITRGHFATGHWSSHDQRMKAYPETKWMKNVRYVADGHRCR